MRHQTLVRLLIKKVISLFTYYFQSAVQVPKFRAQILSELPRSGKNIWKMIFFQVREKSGNFVDGQENSERTLKVREKSGNLKINGYGRQFSENLFCSREERMYLLLR